MGITYTTLKIRNFLTDSEIVELEAKVDTGATMLVLPESTAAQFNFPKIRKHIVKYANEETAQIDLVGWKWKCAVGKVGLKGSSNLGKSMLYSVLL